MLLYSLTLSASPFYIIFDLTRNKLISMVEGMQVGGNLHTKSVSPMYSKNCGCRVNIVKGGKPASAMIRIYFQHCIDVQFGSVQKKFFLRLIDKSLIFSFWYITFTVYQENGCFQFQYLSLGQNI